MELKITTPTIKEYEVKFSFDFTTDDEFRDEMSPRQKRRIKPPVNWNYTGTTYIHAFNNKEADDRAMEITAKIVAGLYTYFRDNHRIRKTVGMQTLAKGELTCNNRAQQFLLQEFDESRKFTGNISISTPRIISCTMTRDYLNAPVDVCQKELSLKEFEELKYAIADARAEQKAQELEELFHEAMNQETIEEGEPLDDKD